MFKSPHTPSVLVLGKLIIIFYFSTIYLTFWSLRSKILQKHASLVMEKVIIELSSEDVRPLPPSYLLLLYMQCTISVIVTPTESYFNSCLTKHRFGLKLESFSVELRTGKSFLKSSSNILLVL